ncbi:MAG: 5-(carboxyamino)imidazole ribonucleotide mutase [Candidatus Nezhaarchaeota archaeon]|nr:5-(carboxyamino)imidazole ribonucleotide mutase [Candidatus Nezhaarchaeota archaeon]MCX8141425.1 5-(carboxyamino)imidazole ribonucleotide mutase [Candidatus Nezhaarchaeota archaeon]MDW8049691.1 5-(carboxyamino)imidazole ribonucleotide mutase [Nitrososphaerota archaeon]
MAKPLVAVIAGSKSDEKIVEEVTSTLKELGIDYDVQYLSAHRNHPQLEEYVRKSEAKVFIAIAGMAAHLSGFIASITNKPVVGVPVSGKLQGLDALLSMVQMPRGFPVATVGIDMGSNAAILAAQILALSDEGLSSRLKQWRKEKYGWMELH